MKIASITVYCNEDFRLNNWVTYYQEYKNEIYKHIIINNGSDDDTNKLNSLFPDSTILFSSNKALTASYNIGLREALSHQEIDAIMLIGNDIKILKGNVSKLYKFLKSNPLYGMVAPVILAKDSDMIEIFGAVINKKNLSFIHQKRGLHIKEVNEDFVVTDSVPGGMNLASREFYEKVGLQDENLFMYSDEIDTGIKAKKHNFLLASTKNVITWHQHTNKSNALTRDPKTAYLIGRNEIYLARKYFGIRVVFSTAILRFKRSIRLLLAVYLKNMTLDNKEYANNYLKGVFAGLFNRMNSIK